MVQKKEEKKEDYISQEKKKPKQPKTQAAPISWLMLW